MEDILQHLECNKNPVNNGIFRYSPYQLVNRISEPSTVTHMLLLEASPLNLTKPSPTALCDGLKVHPRLFGASQSATAHSKSHSGDTTVLFGTPKGLGFSKEKIYIYICFSFWKGKTVHKMINDIPLPEGSALDLATCLWFCFTVHSGS